MTATSPGTSAVRAHAAVRELILGGELSAGTRLGEAELADRLGVSRTPVREALIALEGEGLVRSAPRKGFVVVAPNERMVRESFPILSALEAMAVRLSGEKLRAEAPRLREINETLRREKRKARAYGLDRALHAAFTEHCGNQRLLSLLDMERARAQLIDGAHERGMANLEGSCADHDAIIEAIERGDLETAASLLSLHWEQGVEVVAAWLKKR